MEYKLNTRLNGSMIVTSELHHNKLVMQDKSLYKFIWVRSGMITIEIDHIPMRLVADEVIALLPLHHLSFIAVEGEYQALLFNSNFYCIFSHGQIGKTVGSENGRCLFGISLLHCC